MKHDFGRPLKEYFTHKHEKYVEKEMIESASDQLCHALELTDTKVGVLAATKYLVKMGYNVIRIT